MITTYFLTPTVILWCDIREAHYRQLATAINYDDMAPFSPIEYGSI